MISKWYSKASIAKSSAINDLFGKLSPWKCVSKNIIFWQIPFEKMPFVWQPCSGWHKESMIPFSEMMTFESDVPDVTKLLHIIFSNRQSWNHFPYDGVWPGARVAIPPQKHGWGFSLLKFCIKLLPLWNTILPHLCLWVAYVTWHFAKFAIFLVVNASQCIFACCLIESFCFLLSIYFISAMLFPIDCNFHDILCIWLRGNNFYIYCVLVFLIIHSIHINTW